MGCSLHFAGLLLVELAVGESFEGDDSTRVDQYVT